MTADSEGEEADTLNEMYSEEVIGASFSGSFASSFPQAVRANAERSVIYIILFFIYYIIEELSDRTNLFQNSSPWMRTRHAST